MRILTLEPSVRKTLSKPVVLGKFTVGRNRLQLHVLQYSFDTRFAEGVH
jgi:hypothetical protein